MAAESLRILALVRARGPAADPVEEEVVRLFNELRTPVLRYLISMGVVVADAEEIAQETFLALFHHLRAGKPRANLRAWIFRVAHHAALKLKTRGRAGSALNADTADPAPNPEQAAAEVQIQERLMAVVAALPEQDRACLSLRAEGLRYREIAAVLEISLGQWRRHFRDHLRG